MIKRHYYHGELKSEEVVYDNRLLVYLLGKTAHLVDPPEESEEAVANWEGWMAAIERGLPPPPAPEPELPWPEPAEDEFDGSEVWEAQGDLWTSFPPPAGFDGEEEGRPGEHGYRRELSDSEKAVIEADEAEEREEEVARETVRRDLYFGFEGGRREPIGEADEGAEADEADEADEGNAEAGLFSPREAETNETSARPGPQRREPPPPAQALGARPGGGGEDAPDPPPPGPRIGSL